MLREIQNIRQDEPDTRRRWFTSDRLDLIVWYDREGAIERFQFCYGKPAAEKALTWHRGQGLSHDDIDDGEGRPGEYKQTPVLLADGHFDREAVIRQFEKENDPLEFGLVEFVLERIRNAPLV